MMRGGRTLALLGCATLVPGCAFTFKMPLNRYESSETRGNFRPTISAGLAAQSEVILSPDPIYTAPDSDHPTISQATDLYLAATVGLGQRFEFQLRAPTAVQLKYQWLGRPRIATKEDTFSSAMTFGVGKFAKDTAGTQLFTPEEHRALEASGTSFDAALIFGTRQTDLTLIYGGPFVTLATYSGTYVSTNTTSGVQTTALLSGLMRTMGFNVGVEFGTPTLRVRGETAYAQTAAGSASSGQLVFGAMLGLTL